MKLAAKKMQLAVVQELINNKIDWITKASSPIRIVLFGSAANGEMTEASDLDLIVIYDNDSDLKEIQKGIFMNRPKDDWPQDIFFYTEETYRKSRQKGGGICWLAELEGKTIYSRKENNESK